jgi:predicted N-acetyltransferase YhbS
MLPDHELPSEIVGSDAAAEAGHTGDAMSDPHAERQSLEFRPVDPSRIEPLLNVCFPVESGCSFFDDFPSWNSERALWLSLVGPDGRPAAAAGALPGEWIVGPDGESMTIVRIGGVVTHEAWRGHGLASQLVGTLVEHASSAGARACVLWGQDSSLYRRLGFEPLGRQVRAPLAELVLAEERAPEVLRLEEGFTGAVFRAMGESRRLGGGVTLTSAEENEMLRYRNTRWARVLDAQGTLRGYGAFGKGIDLGFQLHEWGGSPEAVRMIGRWAHSLDARAEIMGTKMGLEEIYGALPGESVVESLCMARVFDPEVRALLAEREDQLWFWGLDGV